MMKKFLFDNLFEDFGADGEATSGRNANTRQSAPHCQQGEGADKLASPPAQEEMQAMGFSEEEMKAACNAAHQEGRQEGLREAAHSNERALLSSLDKLSEGIGQLLERQSAQRAEALAESLKLSRILVRKVMPRYCEQHGTAEIEQVVSDCMAELNEEPRLVIRVHDQNLDPIRDAADKIAKRTGFEGRVVLLAGEEFGQSDVLVEWADGGAQRSVDRQWQDIEKLLARILPARRAQGGTKQPESRAEFDTADLQEGENVKPGVADDTALKAAGNL